MKAYRQLVQELPSKKVVMAFGRFQPPTNGHELLVNAVKKIAGKQKADHIIFASRTQDKKSNPLQVDRKVYYLKKMFPKTNFVAANEQIRTFIEAAGALSKKYKHLVMLAGSDRVPEYKRILEKYNGTDAFNFETIEVVSAGERDPDADNAAGMSGTKMREAAKKGDYQLFKKGLPHTLTDIDGKRLMNEIRQGLGMDVIKEQVKFERNELREKYHAGEIFNVGDKVTDGESVYEVVDRGANYVTVVNESGDISKKWLDSVQPTFIAEDIPTGQAPEEISFKGYKTKNLHHSADATKAFQTTIQRYNAGQIKDAVAILNALKSTDTYMKINDSHLQQDKVPEAAELAAWHDAHDKARDSLNRIGEFMHHFDYWHTHEHEIQDMENNFTPETQGAEFADSVELEGQLIEMKFNATDKIKVARVIASALGLEDVEKSSNPEQLINNALRKVRSKPMRPEYVEVLHKMLQTAKEAEIKYDDKLVPQKVSEETIHVGYRNSRGDWIKTSTHKNYADADKAMKDLQKSGKKGVQHRYDNNGSIDPGMRKLAHEEVVNELSTDLLSRYKKAASDDASAADKAGDFKKGNKRFSGIMKATNKQFANDLKKHVKEEISKILEEIATAKTLGKDTSVLQKQLSKVRSVKDDESDSDTIVQEPNQVGHAMVSPEDNHHLRRMKVAYRTEEADPVEAAKKKHEAAQLQVKHAQEKASLATKQQSEKERLKEGTEEDIPDDEDDLTLGLTKTSEEVEDLGDELDLTDDEMDKIVSDLEDEDDILDAYEDDELALVDDETGEHIEDIAEEVLNEVLSRMERMRAKVRFARTQSKRERKIKIALKSRSSTATINKRARRLAIQSMKQRIAKKPLDKLSVAEKERIERIIQRRKAVINRLAMKMAPRVRKIENDRLAHKSYTK